MKNKAIDKYRAQSIGYVVFFAGLLVAAFMYIMLETPMNKIEGEADNLTYTNASRASAAEQGFTWIFDIFGSVLVFTTGILVFFLIVYAVFQRRGGL